MEGLEKFFFIFIGILFVVFFLFLRSWVHFRQEFQKQWKDLSEQFELRLQSYFQQGFQQTERVQNLLQKTEVQFQSLSRVEGSLFDLHQLLRLPHFRGQFGEWSLEKLLTDFLPPGKYAFQYAIDPLSTERVDAVVWLADERLLPIDSKFPRDALLPLFQAEQSQEWELARKKLKLFIKSQARSIAEKYIRPDQGTVDLALLFLPSEILYYEVVRDADLFQELAERKVFAISPNTLALSLKTLALAQAHYDLARGVEDKLRRLHQLSHQSEELREGLEQTQKALEKAQETILFCRQKWGAYQAAASQAEPPKNS